jgi:hypothetical protein
MGLDFIRRRAKTFTKSWLRNRDGLAQPTLFTRYPECRSRSVVVDLDANADVAAGSRVLVCARGEKLLMVQGTSQVGATSRPPADLLGVIHQAGGNALGHVIRINPISGTADVEVE